MIEWQDWSRSPAAYLTGHGEGQVPAEHPAAVTTAGALAEAQGPGPEGAAEQFIVKLAPAFLIETFLSTRNPSAKLFISLTALFGEVCMEYCTAPSHQVGRLFRWLRPTLFHGLTVTKLFDTQLQKNK